MNESLRLGLLALRAKPEGGSLSVSRGGRAEVPARRRHFGPDGGRGRTKVFLLLRLLCAALLTYFLSTPGMGEEGAGGMARRTEAEEGAGAEGSLVPASRLLDAVLRDLYDFGA